MKARGGTYCLSCGDTRWNVFGSVETDELGECELCGGELTVDRRHPAKRFARRDRDRRGPARTASPARSG